MNLPVAQPTLPAMSLGAVDLVFELEDEVLKRPQIDIPTQHVLHAGMYFRTICMPAGKEESILTGALIKVPTVLIVCGDVTVFTGTDTVHLTGYNVLMASAGRKQAFIAHKDTYITMAFPTRAKTVDEAEVEFTDEYSRLFSRRGDNEIHIGEPS